MPDPYLIICAAALLALALVTAVERIRRAKLRHAREDAARRAALRERVGLTTRPGFWSVW